MSIASQILSATDRLVSQLNGLPFREPVSHVYNPLEYARASHEQYVTRFGDSAKRVLIMGMNPGPWGMAQTGVPFGEIPAVRDWMGITAEVGKPDPEHPKRPIVGFGCEKSEVSGRRLWGLFSGKFPKAGDFFSDHYVVNYCPLVWMEETGRNRTPDKLPAGEMAPVSEACDAYVVEHLQLMEPQFAIGVGAFAESCLKRVAQSIGLEITIGKVLHPSPASPAANRGWSEAAEKQLKEQNVWT
ncbi:MAG: uracil-DNA glycosylase family protein [Verrucomicrobiota bacterium]